MLSNRLYLILPIRIYLKLDNVKNFNIDDFEKR